MSTRLLPPRIIRFPLRSPFAAPPAVLLLSALAVCFGVTSLLAAPTGQEVYRSLCARCHGDQGQGVPDQYEDPLQGDRPLAELIEIIDQTMPAEDPDQCKGEQARAVAEYLFESFYTEEARQRLRPPRIELARMTVRQYLNAAADLVGSFASQPQLDARRGLPGEYYNSRGFRRDRRVLERIDPRVTFDFGTGSPDPKIEAEEFAIQWQGGVIAEETGDYEFVVATDNGVRLWVNDSERALIDAWVKSGDAMEHRATVRLLGGRVYPIRLDYQKSKGEKATVELRWQPPHRQPQTIPERNLTPGRFPATLVVTTDFPADDSSVGYERGTAISEAWDQATTQAAIEIANYVAANIAELAQTPEAAADRQERIKDFCHRFAERAFRRPLDDAQKRFFVEDRFAGQDDLELALKRAVLLILKSPRFLYSEFAPQQPDDYHVASRLSFGLWDSLPDEQLLQAAAQGQLRTPEQVAEQANRMLEDPRTRAKLRYFFHKWLNVERGYDLSKDAQVYPEFQPSLASDALTSLDLLLDDVLWSPSSDFRQLFLADRLFVNRQLAEFYGLEPPEGAGFHAVSCSPEQQSGVLTHPYLMMGLAYVKSSSPIHRGVFLVRSVLGRALRPPPIAVAPLDEGFQGQLSTRERVALQTKPDACQTCHTMINPLGFSLENYDAVGRFRTTEYDQPIDASGSYKALDGAVVEFRGARQLANFLAGSAEVRRSFVQQLFHSLVKQPINAYDWVADRDPEALLREADYNVQKSMIEILRVSALQPGRQPH